MLACANLSKYHFCCSYVIILQHVFLFRKQEAHALMDLMLGKAHHALMGLTPEYFDIIIDVLYICCKRREKLRYITFYYLLRNTIHI